MKQYVGVRNLDEVISLANEKEFELQEGDNCQISFRKGDIVVCLRSFGKFCIYKDGEYIANELSVEFEDEEWYQDILDLFYISEGEVRG